MFEVGEPAVLCIIRIILYYVLIHIMYCRTLAHQDPSAIDAAVTQTQAAVSITATAVDMKSYSYRKGI